MSSSTQQGDGERERLDAAALAKIFAASPFISTLGLE